MKIIPKLPKSVMKSQNAKSKIFIFLIPLGIAVLCSCNSNSKKMVGCWQYTSVLKGDTSIFQISKNDTMVLDAGGLFRYDIQSVNKHETGKWTFHDSSAYSESKSEGMLELHYNTNSATRFFIVNRIGSDSMSMSETDLTFNYIRRRQ